MVAVDQQGYLVYAPQRRLSGPRTRLASLVTACFPALQVEDRRLQLGILAGSRVAITARAQSLRGFGWYVIALSAGLAVVVSVAAVSYWSTIALSDLDESIGRT